MIKYNIRNFRNINPIYKLCILNYLKYNLYVHNIRLILLIDFDQIKLFNIIKELFPTFKYYPDLTYELHHIIIK